LRIVLLVVAGLSGVSCGASRFKKTYPARGRVLFEGKAPEGARVTFHPLGPSDPRAILPQAQVRADGSFTVSTYNFEDGAPAGEYAVAIFQLQGRGPVNLLPARYQDPQTSGLRARVDEPDNELETFHLTRDGVSSAHSR
jgi:hypothetical protein